MEKRKWRNVPHYAHPGWLLGEDHRGVWIELRAGDPVYRGDDILFHGKRGGVILVPPDPGWIAWFPNRRATNPSTVPPPNG